SYGLPAEVRPRVTFNYLGQFDESEDLFRAAPENGGAQHDQEAPLGNWLEVNGELFRGRLNLRWRFSRAMYRRETVVRLAQAYVDGLREVIRHCVSPGAGSLTPSDVPLSGLDQAALDALSLTSGNIEDIYGLAPLQQGLLFQSLHGADPTVYVNQLAVDIVGLDADRFRTAWREALARHPILRTAFSWQGGPEAALQIVYRNVELPIDEVDWSRDPVAPDELIAFRRAEVERVFDLTRPPLFRLALVRLGPERHQMIWTSHHLLLDGWSASRLLGEVLENYAGATPRPVPGRYRDYIAWLAGRDREAGERFWRERLADLPEPTRLADALNCAATGSGHGSVHRKLDSGTAAALQRYAQAQRLTLNTVIQGAWALLLQRCTGRRTVVAGMAVAGRPSDLPGSEAMLGLFINTLPLIVRAEPGQTVGTWLAGLQADNAALREHEHTPLFEIQRWAGERELFDTLLVFENYPVDEAVRRAAERLRIGAIVNDERTHYALTLAVGVADGIRLDFGYDCGRLDMASVETIAARFLRLLMGLVSDPLQRLGTVELLGEAERAALTEWNRGAWEGVGEGTSSVAELIARWAARQPAAVAVVAGDV
ncbi:MAG: non-ribosomal peptide synthetase, partial [Gammaproteobacteria bacterium]|nr:non-ribosomal peptide synthetase [Gammaproteobacteria bacterium]